MNGEKFELHLGLHPTPLRELREDENWWHLGTISMSKKHRTFTSGFGHPIKLGTRFEIRGFDLGEKRGWAIILHSDGTPPEYFVGWLRTDDMTKAQDWVETLNREIQARLAEEQAPQSVTDNLSREG